MHILFLTDNFPPEVNAPASRTFEHCKKWVSVGYKVTVITCAPNFPKGEIFPGYKNKLWSSEEIEGINVIRVWSYIAANEGFSRRILDYLSYMFSSVVASMFVRNVDIVIGTSPQFFTVCGAYFVSVFRRIPWVFELRDMWPESIKAVGVMRQSRIIIFLEAIELFLYRNADLIITVTYSFRNILIKKGISDKKIHVITNGVDLSNFIPSGKDVELTARYQLNDKFVIGYIGTHGLAHGLDTILESAKIIKNNIFSDKYKFVFIGDGAKKNELVKHAESHKLDNVIFLDSVSKSDIARYWSLLDLAIIHLKKEELFKTVIPSKLFESMGMAIPVVHGVSGESSMIVSGENVGVCFESENSKSLCDAINFLYTNPNIYLELKKNGPIAAKKYDRSTLALDMLKIITSILNEH